MNLIHLKNKMRHLILFLFSFLIVTSCKAQKTSKVKKQEEMIVPKITKETEMIDKELFKVKSFKIEKNNLVEEYTKASVGLSKATYDKFSNFHIVKNYLPNGKIENKGVVFNNGSEYGIWYEFDKEGNLIKEINTDEGYDFGWKNIIEYCNQNNIILEKGYPKRGGIKTEVFKNEESGTKVWIISYYDYKKEKYLEITLDGKTGKELKIRELEFVGN